MKARGEYVFLFSGDDYLYGDDVWKRQVDFLENNNDYFSVSARKLHYNQVKQIFIGGVIYGDYTILDYLSGQEASCIYGTMRNIFYLDKVNNEFLKMGARNNEEIKMWVYTLDKGKNIFLRILCLYTVILNARERIIIVQLIK